MSHLLFPQNSEKLQSLDDLIHSPTQLFSVIAISVPYNSFKIYNFFVYPTLISRYVLPSSNYFSTMQKKKKKISIVRVIKPDWVEKSQIVSLLSTFW